jgi:catechol 2,3-dioxygenase-like lactoylglutathione lyase family enzyme
VFRSKTDSGIEVAQGWETILPHDQQREIPMARITAFGGVFFHSPNPQALSDWYRDTLGLKIEDWGGAIIRSEGGGPAYGVWAPFNKDTGHFNPSQREFMINFAVDDLDAFLADLETKGIEVHDRQEMEGMGKFAWILDPDGTKIELWEAPKGATSG